MEITTLTNKSVHHLQETKIIRSEKEFFNNKRRNRRNSSHI